MTTYELYGDIPTEPNKPKPSSYEEATKTYVCTVCKGNCQITMTTHTKGTGPRFCPLEPDRTNLRYAKWEEVQ